MRHSATRALLERDDVIIVASVSCIYGIGSVETYSAMTFTLQARRAHQSAPADRRPGRAAIQAHRRDFARGTFRVRGDVDRHFPGPLRGPRLAREPVRRRGGVDRRIRPADRREDRTSCDFVKVYANSHYVTPRPTLLQAIAGIKAELRERLDRAPRRRPLARSAAPRAAHALRPRNDGGDGLAAPASRTIRAISPADCRASRRPLCSNMCRTMRSSSSTRATSPCRSSAACSAATSGARRRSPNTASACPPAWTTGRCASRNGTRCARRPLRCRRRRAAGRSTRRAACSSSR